MVYPKWLPAHCQFLCCNCQSVVAPRLVTVQVPHTSAALVPCWEPTVPKAHCVISASLTGAQT